MGSSDDLQEQFEIFIYSNATREDDKTELFKTLVSLGAENQLEDGKQAGGKKDSVM